MAAGAFAVPGAPRFARAESYPSRPITMVAPFSAGGPADVLARVFAEGMKHSLGQPVIVENVTGAGGSIAAGRVAHAVPDGYTIIIGTLGTHVINGAIYRLHYDIVEDFEPVILLPNNPMIIVANSAVPAADLRGLISWLKANQTKASAAIAGIGTTTHLSTVLFEKLTGTNLQIIPYRGIAPAWQDVLAGRVDLTFAQASLFLSYQSDGRAKPYAVTAKNRLAEAPNIPTVDEAGLPGLYVSVWSGIWAPKGTPKGVVDLLNSAAVHVLDDVATNQRLVHLGYNIPPRDEQTPNALTAFQKAEIEKWWPIIKATNIKTE